MVDAVVIGRGLEGAGKGISAAAPLVGQELQRRTDQPFVKQLAELQKSLLTGDINEIDLSKIGNFEGASPKVLEARTALLETIQRSQTRASEFDATLKRQKTEREFRTSEREAGQAFRAGESKLTREAAQQRIDTGRGGSSGQAARLNALRAAATDVLLGEDINKLASDALRREFPEAATPTPTEPTTAVAPIEGLTASESQALQALPEAQRVPSLQLALTTAQAELQRLNQLEQASPQQFLQAGGGQRAVDLQAQMKRLQEVLTRLGGPPSPSIPSLAPLSSPGLQPAR